MSKTDVPLGYQDPSLTNTTDLPPPAGGTPILGENQCYVLYTRFPDPVDLGVYMGHVNFVRVLWLTWPYITLESWSPMKPCVSSRTLFRSN
ncbi:hypothetical protein PHLCEN_2v6363 [Hermanssonia centrifuga]|uniref:Uncharacterized protein n=1 Tax=Hermanssonia centrifuga TaxID=98765 RepID=A0A2R6NZP5_9APHY|nr:hypothetical protein PHLCEN_2v6363 [Hermanssonia centrifuga]